MSPSITAEEVSPSMAGGVSLPAGARASWWATVQENIQQSEYHVTWQDRTKLADVPAAFQAPNRAHNLRTYFTPQGIRVIPRTGDGLAWQWGLTLVEYGYDGQMKAPAMAELAGNGNRMEYRRSSFDEWYVNDERGLEQGFTLSERPTCPPRSPGLHEDADGPLTHRGAARAEARGPLRVEMRITGNLRGVLRADGQGIRFATGDGKQALDYGELRVNDAAGTALPAWFDLSGECLSILVDDTDAVYPVTIDPLATSPDWTAESNQANARFGCSVATAGDVNGDGYGDVIIGAYKYDNGEKDEGRAYVYLGSPAGLADTAVWTAESDQPGDNWSCWFGWSVATAGDVNGDGYSDVIVGSPYYESDPWFGAAFVYHGSASGPSITADWMADCGEEYEYDSEFGYSVATAGDVNGDGYSDVIIGAPFYSTYAYEGRAFVYYGSASGLGDTADWTADGLKTDGFFGDSVSAAGDVNGDGYSDVVIGAPAYIWWGSSTYVFHGSASGLSEVADWMIESEAGYYNALGASVSTAGDVNGDGYSDVIIAAPGQTDKGRAFLYQGSASGLSLTPDWTGEGEQDDAGFGHSVATAGDVNGDGYADVIFGEPYYDDDETDEGRALVYNGSPAGLCTTASWVMADTNKYQAKFGFSVAAAGDVNGDGYSDVIVGASEDTNGESHEGRAYVYHGSASGLSPDAGWTAAGDQSECELGFSVATAGDVNGDGYSDLIVGAHHYDNGEEDEGRALVYHGSASGPSSTADWTAESDQAGAEFGYSVAAAGDVNGDGYGDVIVGAPHYGNEDWREGRACAYLGSALGLSATASWIAEGNDYDARFGYSVSTAGDVNGDGYSDVIVGAAFYSNPVLYEGGVFVYHGADSGLSPTANWTAQANVLQANFGSSVSTAGDVNGDGYSDVVIGAENYNNCDLIKDGRDEIVSPGRAFVFHGSPSGLDLRDTRPLGLPENADWTVGSEQEYEHFGYSVSTAGDVNGDGYSDIIVGAPYPWSTGDEGLVFVYHGSPDGLDTTADWTAEGDQADAEFGASVATAGDVNGDGYSDVIVGARMYGDGEQNEGRALVYHGSATGLDLGGTRPTGTPGNADWAAEGGQAGAYFGNCVASAGDVNGDGYSDVVVGARGYDDAETDDGQVSVYYGNGGAGLSLRPQQRRADDSAAIAPLGQSDSLDSFGLRMVARTPYGRQKVKLEWEVKLLGTPFDGLGTQQSAVFVDTGTAGAELTELVTGLSPCAAPYHWRMRFRYDLITSPFQLHGRWLSMQANGWQEMDLRTARLVGDVDCDGDVDLIDLDIFLAVLLGVDMDPNHVDNADLNRDGWPNGVDVQLFVDAFLGL
ncbi:MAG: FG-GAP repeat protein [Phycisphaerae bacterium]|nr:FG-GAP repeat protein [Phycisphaerae bacterium]